MTFANLDWVTGLIGGGLIVLGVFGAWQAYFRQQNFLDHPLSALRNYVFSSRLAVMRHLLVGGVVVMGVLAFLRPQWGTNQSVIEAAGVDVIFTLDVSKSMKARDMAGGARLERTKGMIKYFVQNNPVNRYGLVIFAGEAFVSTPLTFDTEAFLTFLEGVDSDDVGKGGTDLASALKSSLERFVSEKSEKRGRAIVLISDGGESLGEKASTYAEMLLEDGVRLVTVGVGLDEPVPIPEGRDFFGKVVYKKHQGKVVYTQLNDAPLRDLASAAEGDYFRVENEDDFLNLVQYLEGLETTVLNRSVGEGKADRYQIFLFCSFLFFAVLLFFPKGKRLLSLGMVSLFLSGCWATDLYSRGKLSSLNKKVDQNYYSEATQGYSEIESLSESVASVARNNRGIVEYEQRDFETAVSTLESLTEKHCVNEGSDHCDQMYYNLGNALYRGGETRESKSDSIPYWTRSVEAYQQALVLNPEDELSAENLHFVQQKLQQAQQECSPSQGQSGDSNEEKQDSESKGKDEEGSSADSQSGENSDSGEGESGDKEDERYGLDENIKQQVQRYMEDMEKRERQAQRHFQRNPEAENADDFSDPFQRFFGRPGVDPRFGKGNGGEKDW